MARVARIVLFVAVALVAVLMVCVWRPEQLRANPMFRAYLPVVFRNYDGVVQPFGVTPEGITSATTTADMRDLAEVGATWAIEYYAVSWRNVQPSLGAGYSWPAESDVVLRSFGDAGVTPVVVLGGTPYWAAPEDTSYWNGPIDDGYVDEFASFVGAAVTRYSQPPYNIKHWMIYAEPDCLAINGYLCYAEWGDHGASYAAALKAAYPAIKAADPEAKVVFGALAYDNFIDKGKNHPREFLDEALKAGAGPFFDIFAFNYFTIFSPDWVDYGVDILGKHNALQTKLAAYGVTGKPVMVTETGELGAWGDEASLQRQARYVPKLYARGMSVDLKALIWYALRDQNHTHGLITSDGELKPAYHAYETLTSMMAEARYSRALGASDVHLSETSSTVFEGYAFRTLTGTKDLWAVWLNDGSTAEIAARAPSLQVVDIFGARTQHVAQQDGLVRFTLDGSPLYLEISR